MRSFPSPRLYRTALCIALFLITFAEASPNRLASAQTVPAGTAVFASNRAAADGSTDYEIYRSNADGSVTQLTNNAAEDLTPAVSPDGTRVAFSTNRNGDVNFEIYVLSLATPDVQQRLTNSSGRADAQPTWSPDRTTPRIAYTSVDLFAVAFGSSNASDIRVVTVPASGTGVETTAIGGANDQVAPAWSPDGTRIAYMQGSLTNNGAIPFDILTVTVNSAGTASGTPVPQTGNTANDVTPDWSPDSRQIAYGSNFTADSRYEIFRITPRATASDALPVPSQVTDGADDSVLPAFSPNGSQIAFTSGDARQFFSLGENAFQVQGGDNFVVTATGGAGLAFTTNSSAADIDPSYIPVTRKARRGRLGGRR